MLERPRLPRWLDYSLAGSASFSALCFMYAGYLRRWAGDDGFINFRVVRHLLAGNGFVYNAGERSEAVTSALWVFLLWLVGALGFDIESAAWVLSLALSGVGVALAALAAAALHRREDDGEKVVYLPFGALAYAALPAAWDYATSGLENGLSVGFLGGCMLVMARSLDASSIRVRASAAAFIGLAPLVRPDHALFALPLLAILVVQTRGARARAIVAVCAALPATAYQVFRMGYFAALVPNTAFAKEAFAARWDQGLLYLKNTFVSYGVAVPLVCALVFLIPALAARYRERAYARCGVIASMAGAGLLHLIYVVRVGGDFMHGRMLLPGLFAIFASVAVIPLRFASVVELSRDLTLSAVLIGWAFVCAAWLRPEEWQYESILDERSYYSKESKVENPVRLDDYKEHQFYRSAKFFKDAILRDCPGGRTAKTAKSAPGCRLRAHPDYLDGSLAGLPEGASIPLNPKAVGPKVISVIGFRPLGISGGLFGLDVSVVDSFGLADPIAGRMHLLTRGRPGHEKQFPSYWFAAKYGSGATEDREVLKATQALRCGKLRELQRATRAPLTFRRFMKNLRLAFALHDLRIPHDPYEAVRRFCPPASS